MIEILDLMKKGSDMVAYICAYFLALYIIYSIADIIVNADVMKDFLVLLAGLLLGVFLFVIVWGTGGTDSSSLAGKSKSIFDSVTTEMTTKVKP